MRRRSSLLGGNALLQRVKRYASMPALYRMPDPSVKVAPWGAPALPQSPPGSAPAVQPVVASLYVSWQGAPAIGGETAGAAVEAGQATVVPPARPAPQQAAQTPAQPAPGSPAQQPEEPPATPPVQRREAPPPAGLPRQAPAQPSAPPDVQRSESPPPAQVPSQTPAQPSVPGAQPEQPAGQSSVQGDDWNWMSQGEWNRLKDFMAGHQEKLARDEAERAEIKPPPEEIQRAEAKRQAEADLARRQELARKGRLPRANVVYLKPEELETGITPMPELPEPGAIAPSAGKQALSEPPAPPEPLPESPSPESPLPEAPLPESLPPEAPAIEGALPEARPGRPPAAPPDRPPESATDHIAPASARAETQPPPTTTPPAAKPAIDRQPAVQREPQAPESSAEAPVPPAAPAETAPLQTDSGPVRPSEPVGEPAAQRQVMATADKQPPETGETAAAGPQPSVGRRLLKAARSLFRQADDEADEAPAAAPAGFEAARDLPPQLSAEPAPQPEPEPADGRPPAVQKTPEPRLVAPASEDEQETGGMATAELEPAIQEPAVPGPVIGELVSPDVAQASTGEAKTPPSVPPASGQLARQPEPVAEAPSVVETPPEITLQEPAPEMPVLAEPAPRGEPLPGGPPDLLEPSPFASTEAGSAAETPAMAARTPDLQREASSPGQLDDAPSTELPAAEVRRERPPAIEAESPGEPAGQPVSSPPRPAEVQAQAAGPAEEQADFTDDDQDLIDTVIAPLPLQDIWPVEEKSLPQEPPEKPAPAPKPSGPVPQRKASGGDSIGDDVHAALRDVSPAQATDSAVELVTPRRPRPAIPPPPVKRQVDDQPLSEADGLPSAADGPPSAADKLPSAVDRPPSAADRPLSEAGGQPSAADRPSPEYTLPQAPVERSPSPGAASEPYMVPTEIGELPSDLWKLLGERPPSSGPGKKAAPAATVQRELDTRTRPSTTGELAQTQTAVQESDALVTQLFAPPLLQRIESEPRQAIAEPGVSQETGSETEASGEQAIDIDKLARQVLPEIKRRLAVDWERGRGWMR